MSWPPSNSMAFQVRIDWRLSVVFRMTFTTTE